MVRWIMELGMGTPVPVMLVEKPWIALIIALLCVGGYALARRIGGDSHPRRLVFLAPSLAWAGYWVYEQWFIGPEMNIRVDLSLIGPVLWLCLLIPVLGMLWSFWVWGAKRRTAHA